MEQIPNEMLAYLDENLDLVTEYAQTHPDRHGTRVPLTYSAIKVVKHADYRYVSMKIIRNNSLFTYATYEWRNLVKYVEANNNAPPVLK